MNTRRIALVPPRYGAEIVGGAETVIRQVAHGLADRDWQIDIISTCVQDHYTWANDLPAGKSTELTRNGAEISIERFPMVVDTPGIERARVERLLAFGDRPTVAESETWLNDGPRSPELFHRVLDGADDYMAIIASPYMFWTTVAAASVAPEKTLLRPCLHDEPYARMELFEPVLTGVGGVWLQTQPELDLYEKISRPPAQTAIVGEGLEVPESYNPQRFRDRIGIGNKPFLLYGGRREGAKGWDELLLSFANVVRGGDVDLTMVTFGVGPVEPPRDIADRVIDLGFIDDETRDDAMAAASAYLQPSALESFSRTVMEAWMAGTPVIANGASDVVRWHVERSGAGLVYADHAELDQALRFIAEAPDQAAQLARPGRDYVLDNYTWPTTLDRMEKTIEEWFG